MNTTSKLLKHLKKEYSLTDKEAESEVVKMILESVRKGKPPIKEFRNGKVILNI